MKKTVVSALGIALLALSLAPMATAAENDIDGQAKYLEYKCVMCHSVAAVDMKAKAKVEKMKGPDLSGYEAKGDFSKMASYLRGEIAPEGKKHTKPFKGSDEELQAIVDWLGSLEAQE